MYSSHSFLHESIFEKIPDIIQDDKSIRILMIGDVIGQPGRKVLKQNLQKLRESLQIDFVVANVENLAGGFGITQKTFEEMLLLGVDCMTMGNHWNDKPDVHRLRHRSELVLPFNLPNVEGVEKIKFFELPKHNRTVSMLNFMGIFGLKGPYNDPFVHIQKLHSELKSRISSGSHIVLLDMHAESSAEKQAVAWYLDGSVTAVVGTHTHTPTSDERILPHGTAFLTDLGMTGAYNSVIGMTVERSLTRYFPPVQKRPQEVAKEDVWMNALLVEVSSKTGLSLAAHRIQHRVFENAWSISTHSII